MVSVDTVYQRVLAILNKENRGYMTPQEFNLLANQAQLEIFEQYFYDLTQFNRGGQINNEFANIVKNIKEKINLFKKTATLTYSTDTYALPSDLYRLGTVYYNDSIEVEPIDQIEFLYINTSPLTKPDTTRPIYTRSGLLIKVYPTTITSNTEIAASYIKKPATAEWAHVEVTDDNSTDIVKLFDSSSAVDFELHESEETVLVYKILAYAGLVIKQPEISQVAETKDSLKTQKEKS